MEITLLHDIYSYTRSLYGREGEKVSVVSDHGNVLIVRGETGRFPVHVSQTDKQQTEERQDPNEA